MSQITFAYIALFSVYLCVTLYGIITEFRIIIVNYTERTVLLKYLKNLAI